MVLSPTDILGVSSVRNRTYTKDIGVKWPVSGKSGKYISNLYTSLLEKDVRATQLLSTTALVICERGKSQMRDYKHCPSSH